MSAPICLWFPWWTGKQRIRDPYTIQSFLGVGSARSRPCTLDSPHTKTSKPHSCYLPGILSNGLRQRRSDLDADDSTWSSG